MTQHSPNRKKQRGQSMVETALVLPFVLLLVFGVFELGRIVFVFSAVNNASREAARFGTASGATGGGVPRYLNCNAIRQTAIDTAFLAGLAVDDIQIEYDSPVGGTMQVYGECDGGTPEFVGTNDIIRAEHVHQGDRVRVTVNRQIDPILSIFPSFNPTFVTARTILKEITIGPPECSDGADNDGDGDTDFPDDSGCSSADDTIEAVCYRLSVVALPAEGGTMSLNPSTNCANRYIEDTIVNLEAFTDIRNEPEERPEYTFDFWEGPVDTGDPSKNNPTTVTMDADKDVTAHFRLVQSDLGIDKEALPNDTIGAGEDFEYRLEVINYGPDTAHDIEVTDILPAGVTLRNWDSSKPDGNCDVSAYPSIACSLPELADGDFVLFYIRVTAPVVNGTAQPLSNTATVTAYEGDPVPANDTDTVIVTVEPRAELSIEKEGPTGTVWAETEFDYIIHVTNDGPSNATNVVVSDPLDTDLTFVSSDDCTYDAGTRVVTCEIPLISPTSTETVTFRVQAPPEEADVTNVATVEAAETENDTSDNTSDGVGSDIESHADLSIDKIAPTSVDRDQAFTYSLSVTNLGPSTARNVTISDPLPPGVNFISEPGGSCSESGGVVTCNLGNMADGETRQVVLNVEATVDTEGGPPLNNVATVSSLVDDLNSSNNSDPAQTNVILDVQLTIEKSAPNSVEEGQIFSYEIDVGNSGDSTATGVALTDTLPDEVDFISISDGGWDCDTSALPEITCTPPGELFQGQSSATISIEVVANDVGNFTNTATLDSDETDSVSDSAGVTSDPDFDLSLEISGPSSATADTSFDFTVSVANSGPSDVADAQVTITLDDNVTFGGANGTGWNCGATSTTQVVCTSTNTLAANAISTITVSVTPAAAPSVTNSATVSATGESNTGNNSGSLSTTIGP